MLLLWIGNSVRLRDPGLAWSYYSTDPEWGLMQAKAIIVELEEALSAHDVRYLGPGGRTRRREVLLLKGALLVSVMAGESRALEGHGGDCAQAAQQGQ